MTTKGKMPQCMIQPAYVREMRNGSRGAVLPKNVVVKRGTDEAFVLKDAMLVRPGPGRVIICKDGHRYHADLSLLAPDDQFQQVPGWILASYSISRVSVSNAPC